MINYKEYTLILSKKTKELKKIKTQSLPRCEKIELLCSPRINE